jgi:hypothetical protein
LVRTKFAILAAVVDDLLGAGYEFVTLEAAARQYARVPAATL